MLVVALDGVGDADEAELVVGAGPAVAGEVGAELEGLVDFGVGVAFVLAFVPAEAAEERGGLAVSSCSKLRPKPYLTVVCEGVGGDDGGGGGIAVARASRAMLIWLR